jgi:hypothetical protein
MLASTNFQLELNLKDCREGLSTCDSWNTVNRRQQQPVHQIAYRSVDHDILVAFFNGDSEFKARLRTGSATAYWAGCSRCLSPTPRQPTARSHAECPRGSVLNRKSLFRTRRTSSKSSRWCGKLRHQYADDI